MVTFDQPLYWKAYLIMKSEPSFSEINGIVLKLGGFHTLMSFLGSIGHIMDGSGLQEILEIVFAKDSVPHLLSVKAYARAVRAHTVLSSALINLLLEEVFEEDGKRG